MKEAWTIYRVLAGGSVRARMQYKVNFIVSTVLYGFLILADFLSVGAILHRFGAIAGWGLYEVALLFGVSGVCMGLVRTFASEFNTFETYVVEGTYDSILTRPIPPLLNLLSRNVDLGRLGMAVQGLLVTAIGAWGLAREGALPIWGLAYLPLLFLAGTVLFLSLMMATASMAFWVTRVDELQTFTIHAPQNAGFYPMHIYPRWIQAVLTTVLPVAYINYIPIRYLLGRGGGPWDLFLPAVVAALALTAATSIWRLGERRYQSTGS